MHILWHYPAGWLIHWDGSRAFSLQNAVIIWWCHCALYRFRAPWARGRTASPLHDWVYTMFHSRDHASSLKTSFCLWWKYSCCDLLKNSNFICPKDIFPEKSCLSVCILVNFSWTFFYIYQKMGSSSVCYHGAHFHSDSDRWCNLKLLILEISLDLFWSFSSFFLQYSNYPSVQSEVNIPLALSAATWTLNIFIILATAVIETVALWRWSCSLCPDQALLLSS